MRQLDKDFKFVVVGGGSAGWMTAIYLKNYFPEVNVTVIASSEFGILGAGETVAPDMFDYLIEMGISLYDFVTETDSTIKNLGKFTNWNGIGTSYVSPVGQNSYSYHAVGNMFTGRSMYELEQIAKGENLDSLHLSAILTNQGKVPFRSVSETSAVDVGIHMNANKAATFLKKVALVRDIHYVDAKVADLEANEVGDLTNIILEGGSKVPCDFVFDCSGFRRLILGKFYKTPWVSYKKHLPVNTAIPFFEPHEGKNIRTYTEAIAMKNGWMWKTPVRDRFGYGYVFDNEFINEEQALQEINEYMGYEVESPVTFRFEPGAFEKTWVNNCIGLGMAAGFVEPLEGTAIFSTIVALRYFVERIAYITLGDKKVADRYYDIINTVTRSFLEFIQFHYITKRNDSEFWRTFRQKNELLPIVQELVDTAEYTVPNRGVFGKIHSLIPTQYWYIVGCGLHLWKPENGKALLDSYAQGKRGRLFEEGKVDHMNKINSVASQMMTHDAFLAKLAEVHKYGFKRPW